MSENPQLISNTTEHVQYKQPLFKVNKPISVCTADSKYSLEFVQYIASSLVFIASSLHY